MIATINAQWLRFAESKREIFLKREDSGRREGERERGEKDEPLAELTIIKALTVASASLFVGTIDAARARARAPRCDAYVKPTPETRFDLDRLNSALIFRFRAE